MTLAAYFHDLSPFAIRITETFGVRWYGLAYIAGFVVAYVLMYMLAKRGLIRIPAARVPDAMTIMILGTLIGGRLGYVLVYDRSLLSDFTSSAPWWGVLAINKGGMASHGGMVGVILAAWRVSRGWKTDSDQFIGRCSPVHVMDVTALLAPAGLFFGRLANFINGELLGKIVSPPGLEGPAWSVQFPQELADWVNRDGRLARTGHAPALSTEQQTAMIELVMQQPGDTWHDRVTHLVAHAREFEPQLKPLLASRHPSQLYQAIAEGVIVGAVVWLVWARPRKPGVVGAWFLISYGILRVVTEFWRLPDAQFIDLSTGSDGRFMGLSRGQWLSVLMVVVGVGVLIWASRRSAEKIGGWLKPA